ncbi:MAG: ankyrin repeat domain-containing protein [Rhodospirillaceae bacterium]|nr:ankyrin repeat domain-containing protein [Rhodospirillaceae bacterium]
MRLLEKEIGMLTPIMVLAMLALPNSSVGQESLHAAIERGDLATLEALTGSGADLEVRDAEGFTPLLAAAYDREAAMVRSLVEAGSDVHARVSGSGWTPLHAVAWGLAPTSDSDGLIGTVTILLSADAAIEARDGASMTSLHAAVQNSRNSELVTALLAAGADVDPRDDAGWTPLFYAAAVGKVDAIRVLVASGADVGVRATGVERGWTPLHQAANNGHETTVLELVETRADVKVRSGAGTVALHVAARRGHAEIVAVLLTSTV